MSLKTIRLYIFIAAFWLLIGLCAASTALGANWIIGDFAIVLPTIPLCLLSRALNGPMVMHGVLWTSGHGPPALNVYGVLFIYIIPSVALMIATLVINKRQKDRPEDT